MKHPDERELTLYLLGDDEDRAALAPHLEACAECSARVARLDALLAAAAAAPVPEPDAGFEERIWSRQRSELQRRGALTNHGARSAGDAEGVAASAPATRPVVVRPPLWSLRRLVLAGAMAASLLLAFLIGLYTPTPGTPGSERGAAAEERILLVAVGDHLARTRMVLVEIANAERPGDLEPQRVKAEELIGQNRLYRQTARLGGQPAVAELLGEIERVLLDLAQAGDAGDVRELEWLRQRIADRDLLFKVQIIEGSARRGAAAARPTGRDL